jgi:DNA anti-recombination protein RmuC
LLADLPEPVEAGLKSLLTYLRSLVQAQKTSAEELPALRQARQQLQEEVDQLRTALRSLEERQETLQSELARTREDRDAERRSREEVEQAHAALQAASGRQEKELRTAKEDYERLSHRSDQDLGQIRQHVLDGLHMDLRETWELMARMLEKVLQGQREPRHLASVWNQLDEILWSRLGTSGYPVDEPPT